MKSIMGLSAWRRFSVAPKLAQPQQISLMSPQRKVDPSNPFLMRGKGANIDAAGINLGGNYNVSLTHFFSLPVLEKKECE